MHTQVWCKTFFADDVRCSVLVAESLIDPRACCFLCLVVYIAPLKALVRERIDDWSAGLCRRLKKRMVELTGEYTPDIQALLAANIIICTPEKWDGISRKWQSRGYVKKVITTVDGTAASNCGS
eukprot:scaffold276840_cov21-Prasinocladus_malaysianus.AAC.1